MTMTEKPRGPHPDPDAPPKAHPNRTGGASPEALLHELQIHQIELEMSNEALKEAQIELEASRDQWADLYETAPVGYFTLDRSGRILKMNLTGASMLRWKRDAMLNRSFMDFVAPEDRQRWGETFCRLRESRHDEVVEFTLVRGDVQFLHVRLDCQSQNVPAAAVGAAPTASTACVRIVLSDVGERKRAQAVLEQHRRHLESVLVTRTAELLKATGEAQAGTLAKSAFLARMSHEVRTPMNAIVGFTQLLRQAEPTGVQAHRLDIVADAASQLMGLFNDVLDLASLEAGNVALRCSRFSWLSIMEELCDEITGPAQQKGLVVESVHDTEPFWLWGDAQRVKQAWRNMAVNAVKFTDKGRIVLRARVVDESHRQLQVRFEVQDTGIGMSTEQTSSLFQAFEQGDGSATRRHGGAGLGLTLSRELARLMGGEAGVESTLGVGSLFWFTARFDR